jgi:hypothetical protein
MPPAFLINAGAFEEAPLFFDIVQKKLAVSGQQAGGCRSRNRAANGAGLSRRCRQRRRKAAENANENLSLFKLI